MLPESTRTTRCEVVVLAGILSLALTARVVFLAGWAGLPLFDALYGDEGNFHRTALAILGLQGQAEAFFYQPFYALWLALVYGLFGVDTVLVRTLQLGLGLLGVGLAYGLARELGGRRVALVAGLMAAVYGPFVFFEGHLLDPALSVPLLTGGLWCVLRAGLRQRAWLLLPGGLLGGLACLARPNLALVLPAVGLWWLFAVRDLRPRLVGAGLALAGVLLGLMPSWAFNWSRGEAANPISSSAGISFFIGNNPRATGRFHVPRGLKIDATSHAAYQRSLQVLAEQAEGRRLTASEASSHWLRRGLDFWAEHPGQAAWLAGKKALLALNADEMPIHHPFFVARELVPALGFLPGFGVVFPFAVLGLWLGWRRRGVGLLAACLGSYLASLVLFYVADRYRLMLVPMLLPLFGLGIVELWDRVRSRGAARAWPHALLMAGALLISAPDLIGDQARRRSFYSTYNLMGKAEGERDDLASATTYFQRAIELAGPGHGALARANLGLVRERLGDVAGALELARQASAIDREGRGAWLRRARLAERQGHLQEAAAAWRHLASLQAEPEEALREAARLEAMLEARPAP
jgi:4-amino-4-deoxy-L-arabinose transferase-like glycosyltransferase